MVAVRWMLPQTFGPEPPGLWSRVLARQPSNDVCDDGESVSSLGGSALSQGRRRTRRRRHAVHTTVMENRWLGAIVERRMESWEGSSCASSLTELSLRDADDGPPRDRASRWQDVACALREAEEQNGSGAFSLHYSKIGDDGARLLAAAIQERYPEQSRDPFAALPSTGFAGSALVLGDSGKRAGGTIPFSSMLLGTCELSVAGLAPLSAAIRRRGFAAGESGGVDALHLGNNPELCDSGMLALVQMLPPKFVGPGDLSTLRMLYLEQTGCGDEGLQALCLALRRLPRLEELHLSDNPSIADPGWQALGAVLPFLPRLRELRASRCHGMACAGVAGLVAKLPTMQGQEPEGTSRSALEELYIDDCRIGLAGARALTAVLQYCSKLTRLNVRDNPFGSAGRAALQTAASKRKPGSSWSWGEGHPIETPLRLSYHAEASSPLSRLLSSRGGPAANATARHVELQGVK
eukprot:COSAG02_NODE_652_length_18867_cov_30.656756_11_plen_465_part_00